VTETYGDWERPPAGGPPQEEDLARRDTMRRELERVYAEAARLETALRDAPEWDVDPGRMVFTYHVLAGLVTGFVGAAAGLIYSILASLLLSLHPLLLIRVYLTLPYGERALNISTGPMLALGVITYLVIGALYGIPFHVVLEGVLRNAPGIWRTLIASAMGLIVWVVNYYVVLLWLQPTLTGGQPIAWLVPSWLAASTHLVFAWTMVVIEGRGRFNLPTID
jgi:hypothetical protein